MVRRSRRRLSTSCPALFEVLEQRCLLAGDPVTDSPPPTAQVAMFPDAGLGDPIYLPGDGYVGGGAAPLPGGGGVYGNFDPSGVFGGGFAPLPGGGGVYGNFDPSGVFGVALHRSPAVERSMAATVLRVESVGDLYHCPAAAASLATWDLLEVSAAAMHSCPSAERSTGATVLPVDSVGD